MLIIQGLIGLHAFLSFAFAHARTHINIQFRHPDFLICNLLLAAFLGFH